MLFVVPVYKEPHHIVQYRVDQIKYFHPRCSIITITDGAPKRSFIGTFNYCLETRLKTRETSHFWLKAFYELVLSNNDDLFIKIDPDCDVVKTFDETTAFGDFFSQGSYFPTKRISLFIALGAYGFTRKGAQRVLDSKLLEDPVYAEPLYAGWEQKILASVLTRLDIPFVNNDAFSFVKQTSDKTCFWHK